MAGGVGLLVPVCRGGSAQPTVCGFSPTSTTDTPYYDYPWSGSLIGPLPTKSTASGYFYRLELDNQGSTNNTLAFDQTDTNNVTNVTVDFDFRMGRDTLTSTTLASHPADGLAIVLLNTSITQNSQNALTSSPGSPITGDAGVSITEEAAAIYSLGVGMDIYANAGTDVALTANYVNGGYLNASDNNIKITFNGIFNDLGTASGGNEPDNHQLGTVYKPSLDVGSNGGAGYRLNFDKPNFDDSDWDHFNMVVDLVNQVATVTITPAASQSQPAFAIFNNYSLPGISPYPMRLEFGSRTGGATSNIDIANVNAVFTP